MNSKPFIVAGPCSAESAEQVSAAALALKGGTDIFRAGLWKPRTVPGEFEGVGESGLGWLLDVRTGTGLPVATEVLCAAHARLCVEAGVDAVWVGARTTANPFLVQEIADALKGSSLTVLVKNPISPDARLWAGAVRRLSVAGEVVLVHRGFTPVEPGEWRNDPRWGVAIKLRSEFPQLRMLCDPSHLTGCASLVGKASRKAMDLGFDGLMVEVHPDPSKALSDGPQQLSPEQFTAMLSGLKVRSCDCTEALEGLRARMDEIDSDIVRSLAERMNLSREIGRWKRENSVPILQTGRWASVLAAVCSQAESLGLSPDLVRDLFERIHEESIANQN